MKPLLALLLTLAVLCGCATVGPRVAIVDFQNNTGEANYDFLGAALPEFLTPALSSDQTVRVLERQTLRDFFAEIDPSATDRQALRRWRRLGRAMKADYFIVGSVSRLDRNFILTARLFDVRTGRILPGTAVTSACIREEELYDRAQTIAAYLAEQLRALRAERDTAAP